MALPMRTNIEIDEKLMKQAQRLSGLKTKRAVVNAALQMFVRVQRQKGILKLAGKVHWHGDLDEMRRDLDDPG
jgi:Arc/MetJ family transcription regulator